MHGPAPPTRRRVLKATGAALVGGSIAGCVGDDGSRAAETPSGTSSRGTTTDATGGTEASTGSSEPDRREANVVGVEFQAEGDGRYRFSVTLHHDDAGEPGYANRWQVERLDGSRLGRRDLLHPHDRQPFTRSETIEIPASVTCVVVRGHDETHGYGGRAMLVHVAAGVTRSVDQGRDPLAFDETDCP
jgi:hypothetical protein